MTGLRRRLTRTLRGLLPGTLRARLIAGLLALLVVTCTGIGLATTEALRHFLVGQVDQQLSATGGRYAASLEHPGKDGSDTRAQAPGTFGARLVDGTVTHAGVVCGTPAGSDDPIRAADGTVTGDAAVRLSDGDRRALGALPVGGPPAEVVLSGLGHYRANAVAGHDGDVLVTGLPLHPVQETVQKLITVELLVFGVGLAAAGIAGALWVRLSLRPLERVAGTAERVSALPLASGAVALTERVPDDDPRTEVGRVGAALNRMLGHVEDALGRRHAVEERLRGFAADASHELRNPVAAVRGHAELALRHPGPVPEPVRHSLQRIDAESQRMGTIVEDLLLLARLDAGRPLADAGVDLTRLALDGVADARAAGPGHRWRLQLPEEPVLVTGDEERLRQVIANLLANARTHTPDGTEVTLTLERTDDSPGRSMPPAVAARQVEDGGHPAAQSMPPAVAARQVEDGGHPAGRSMPPAVAARQVEDGGHPAAQSMPPAGGWVAASDRPPPRAAWQVECDGRPGNPVPPAGWVRLSVVDGGPGIEGELVGRVFERFVRGDRARSRRTGSTGLGLAIVRAVVAAHGGAVELASRPGRTVFTVVLPGRSRLSDGQSPEV